VTLQALILISKIAIIRFIRYTYQDESIPGAGRNPATTTYISIFDFDLVPAFMV